jgi:Domain of unknown function (DUF1917)
MLKFIKYPDNYCIVDKGTRKITQHAVLPPNVEQDSSYNFIYVLDAKTYQDDEDLALRDWDSPMDRIENMRAGKWLLEIPPSEVDLAWEKIITGVKDNELWRAKVTLKNAYPTHLICVYVPEFHHIHELIRSYNYLVEIGLADVNQPLNFKTDQATEQGSDEVYCTSNDLPSLMLNYLDNQILDLASKTGSDLNAVKFAQSLRNLHTELSSEVKNGSQKEQLTCVKIAAETADMLINLKNKKLNVNLEQDTKDRTDYNGPLIEYKKGEKIKIIQTFEDKCTKTPCSDKILRAILTVIMAAVGMVLGAAIGAGIGALTGAITGGPLAVITGSIGAVAGLFKGTVTGYAVGLALGSSTAAAVTGYLYRNVFSKRDTLVKEVAEKARTCQL